MDTIIGVLIFIGVLSFVLNIFKKSGEEKSTVPAPKGEWYSGSPEAEDETPLEYTFDGLPNLARNHYSLHSLRPSRYGRSEYHYYKPTASKIRSDPEVSWRPRLKNYADREYVHCTVIDSGDVRRFRTVSNQTLVSRLDQDIADCNGATGAYPVTAPHAVGEVFAPKKPTLELFPVSTCGTNLML